MEWGLVNEVVAADRLLARAREIADHYSRQCRAGYAAYRWARPLRGPHRERSSIRLQAFQVHLESRDSSPRASRPSGRSGNPDCRATRPIRAGRDRARPPGGCDRCQLYLLMPQGNIERWDSLVRCFPGCCYSRQGTKEGLPLEGWDGTSPNLLFAAVEHSPIDRRPIDFPPGKRLQRRRRPAPKPWTLRLHNGTARPPLAGFKLAMSGMFRIEPDAGLIGGTLVGATLLSPCRRPAGWIHRRARRDLGGHRAADQYRPDHQAAQPLHLWP